MMPRLQSSSALCGLAHHQPSISLLTAHRSFTTTPPLLHTFKKKRTRKQRRTHAHNLEPFQSAPTLPPPYPYGSSYRLYKQSDTGLYGGLRIRFGNRVSERNEIKTRRTWRPNIVRKNLYSIALGRQLKLKVATRVLRTVDKVGGLDEYLLGTKPARLKELGAEGWHLRWAVLQALKDSERVRSDPQLLLELESGLPREGQVVVEQNTPVGTIVEIEGQQGQRLDAEGMEDAELEERVQQRLEESRHMREEPPPSTMLQRMGKTITGLFKRR